ncbi:hypothetical protein ARHIZOSPH14_03450 [Agromyces rhizosphaerae]|uniref:Uncharacterized protein n=1 Tax=Agromyces rhizosphaerae TaxID=88374 RepID=A0A9W6FQI3_9MICO|nr:hypothetical protein [Agromyces rhizosphaerae]GLI26103.1 hypothetical protein ARHIZOSPH14_03450 [Agromyces rhizosphaerae]
MNETAGPSWADDAAGVELSPDERAAEERLELVDRIAGLEAQVAELQRTPLLSPTETMALERNVAAMQESTTWRVGRAVMFPVRALRYAKRRFLS